METKSTITAKTNETAATTGISQKLAGDLRGRQSVKAYRKRYGVDFNCAFTELEMLGVPIDPDCKESVLQTVAAQAAVKRQKRSRLRAQRADVWSEYEDDDTALEQAGECVCYDMFRLLDDLGLCGDVGAGHFDKLSVSLIRQRDWEYAAVTEFLSDEGREALRHKIVNEYGEGLELIDPA